MKKKLFVLICSVGIISGILLFTFFSGPPPVSTNTPPQLLTSFPSDNIVIKLEGESQIFSITAFDPDNDLLSYAWTMNGTPIGQDSGNFTFISNYTSAGVYLIEVRVSDGIKINSTFWLLTILNVNRMPVISNPVPAIDPTINEGDSQEFNITVTDPDNDSITFQWSIDGAPVGMNSSEYIHPTGFDDEGSYQVTINVTDGDLSAQHSWILYVGDVNRAPIISNPQPAIDPTIDEGDSQEFSIDASDLDGDPLTYHWTLDSSPVGTNSSSYTLTTDFEDEGVYSVNVNATDGELSDTYTWTLTVLDVNNPPSIDSYYPLVDPTFNETYAQKFNVSASDPELNSLTYIWSLDGQITGSNSTEFWYFTTFLSAGIHELNITIFDGKVETRHTWQITVRNNITLLSDINPSGDSSPANFVIIGPLMFFTATDGVHNYELWVTNGTPSGTYMVEDIRVGAESASCQYLTAMNGILYFSAYSDSSGRELWRSDGTSTGTYMVKDINVGSSSCPSYLTVMNNILYFQADDRANYDVFPPEDFHPELWRSDGTSGGTYMVRDLDPNYGSYPESFCVVGNTLFFEANDQSHGPSLYRTNGAYSNTVFIKEVDVDNGWGIRRLGTKVIFREWVNPTYGDELWVSDGTATGTFRLKDIAVNASSPDPSIVKIISNTMYFTAYNGTYGRELWKTDGTSQGTSLIKDIYPGATSGCELNPESAVLNNILYFEGYSPDGGHELWRTNGTEAGTFQVQDIEPGSGGDIAYLVTGTDFLYFSAYNSSLGTELWISDGTEAGTQLVADSKPGSLNSNPRYLTTVGNDVFYCAYSNGGDIWVSDGTASGTHYLAPLKFPDFIRRWDSTVFVLTNEFACGNELYLC